MGGPEGSGDRATKGAAARAERQARLAQALRLNLRRRKSQARARAPESGPRGATKSPSPEDKND